MFGLIALRAIGMGCVMTVLSRHVELTQWEGCLLGFSVMTVLGTLYDVSR